MHLLQYWFIAQLALIMLIIFAPLIEVVMSEFKGAVVGLLIFLTGISSATIGHYAEAWIFAYLLSAVLAIISGVLLATAKEED